MAFWGCGRGVERCRGIDGIMSVRGLGEGAIEGREK